MLRTQAACQYLQPEKSAAARDFAAPRYEDDVETGRFKISLATSRSIPAFHENEPD
jgi:hypothetical protein